MVIRPEAPGDGAMAMAPANPRQRFDLTVAALLQARCAPCHGGANGTATAALDLAKLMDPSMAGQAAACAQVLGRINPGAPEKSQLFAATAPTAPGNHAYKYPDQPSFDLFVQTVSQWIVKEK